MKPKLIIVDGAQGCGKTTITNWLREQIPYTNLMRMSGHKFTSSKGRRRSMMMYGALREYLRNVAGSDAEMNFVFDRIFVSDWVYSILGFRDYTVPILELIDDYSDLNRYYDIVYITLHVSNEEILKERLARDKCEVDYAKFDIRSSMRQQCAYLDIHEVLSRSFKCYTIDTSKSIEEVKSEISEILDMKKLIEKAETAI